MKLLKRIVTAIVSVFLILLITFNIYNFVSINLLHKDLAKVAGYAILEVVSGSMEPTIMVGDLIVIDTNCKEYQNNDIITFRDINDAFVTHRIISIDNDKGIMITQGDANDSKDEAMSTSTIVGKYAFKIPAMGKVMSSLKNPIVMILILVAGIIVCALVSTDDKTVLNEVTEDDEEFLEFKRQKELASKSETDSKKEEQVLEEIKLVKKKPSDSKKEKQGEIKSTTKNSTKKTKEVKEEQKTENAVKKEVKAPKKTSSSKNNSSASKNTKKTSSSSKAKKTK